MKSYWVFVILFFASFLLQAQYSFHGYVDKDRWQSDVYLSYVEDYRKINGVYSDQKVNRTSVDSLGYFKLTGNQLENENRIYRIHVDNCNSNEEGVHFNGHCEDSNEIVFIAKNTDTIHFPESFDDQMFCLVNSTNESTNALIRIDSIINLMKYAYTDVSSEANNKLNHQKWFNTLQEFGTKLNEPLADLYIYQFLSDRANITYDFYKNDLESNDYYLKLADKLESQHPNTSYTDQYLAEFKADNFIQESQNVKSDYFPKWILFGVGTLLLANGVLAFIFLYKRRNKKMYKLNLLTKQEKVILESMRQNKSNKEIAEINFISVSTVKTHINSIYKKLNIRSRDEIKSL